jgi:hypothetical protein
LVHLDNVDVDVEWSLFGWMSLYFIYVNIHIQYIHMYVFCTYLDLFPSLLRIRIRMYHIMLCSCHVLRNAGLFTWRERE